MSDTLSVLSEVVGKDTIGKIGLGRLSKKRVLEIQVSGRDVLQVLAFQKRKMLEALNGHQLDTGLGEISDIRFKVGIDDELATPEPVVSAAKPQEIKAIPTRYKGYHFRSRSEARCAVFFDSLGIVWNYEQEGYALNSGCYLPDFYLPNARSFLEIKPGAAGEGDVPKWKELVDLTGNSLVIFNADFDHPFAWLIVRKGVTAQLQCNPSLSREHVLDIVVAWLHGNLCRVDDAVKDAKSARFEHGESGPT